MLSRRTLLRASLAAPGLMAREARAQPAAPAAPPVAPLPLLLRRSSVRLLPEPGPLTDIAGFEGGLAPEPVLLRREEEAALLAENRLDEAVALAAPGLRIEGAAAGPLLGPIVLAAGERRDLRLRPSEPGSYLLGAQDPEQADRGMTRALIVTAPEEPAVDLDAPLLVREVVLTREGRVVTGAEDPLPQLREGRARIALLANGRAEALTLAVAPRARVRLRLMNASTLLAMPVRIDGEAFLYSRDGMATEGRWLGPEGELLGPGQRLDLLIDAGDQPGSARTLVAEVGTRPVPLARIVAQDRPAVPARAPATITRTYGGPVRLDLARAVRVPFQVAAAERWTLQGQPSPGVTGRPLARVARGGTVVLQIGNDTPFPLAVRAGGLPLRPLDALDDGWKPWLLHTAMVPPWERLQVGFIAEQTGLLALEAAPAALLRAGVAASLAVG